MSSLWGIITVGQTTIALEPDEIRDRLQAIPVFTVTDQQGNLLIIRVANGGYTGIFFAPDGAIAFRDKAIEDNPDLIDRIKVTPIALSWAYQLKRQVTTGAAANYNLTNLVYVPAEAQLESAQTLRSEIRIADVPLFTVKVQSGRDAQSPRYLTVPHNVRSATEEGVTIVREVIPFYFAQEQAQILMEQYNQLSASQDRDRTAVLEVHTLANVLYQWEEHSEATLEKIWLIPDPASLQYLHQTQPTR